MGHMSPEAIQSGHVSEDEDNDRDKVAKRDWKKQIRLLTYSFLVSGGYVSCKIICIAACTDY